MNSEELQRAYENNPVVLDGGRPSLRRLAKRIHINSVNKRFYDDPVIMDKVAAKIALIHSEGTEVLEALRKNQGANAVTEEVVDILIRTLDLHEFLVDLGMATDELDDVMSAKMIKNENRPPKHGHSWG